MNTPLRMDMNTTLAMDTETMLLMDMDTDTTLAMDMETLVSVGTNNTSFPLDCWKDWQKNEDEDKWVPVIFAGIMSSVVLAANLTVIVTIFTTEKMRNKVILEVETSDDTLISEF